MSAPVAYPLTMALAAEIPPRGSLARKRQNVSICDAGELLIAIKT